MLGLADEDFRLKRLGQLALHVLLIVGCIRTRLDTSGDGPLRKCLKNTMCIPSCPVIMLIRFCVNRFLVYTFHFEDTGIDDI
jgi:hypothetical protein